jgi:type II secretory pathway component GspD/PulD (secretin)
MEKRLKNICLPCAESGRKRLGRCLVSALLILSSLEPLSAPATPVAPAGTETRVQLLQEIQSLLSRYLASVQGHAALEDRVSALEPLLEVEARYRGYSEKELRQILVEADAHGDDPRRYRKLVEKHRDGQERLRFLSQNLEKVLEPVLRNRSWKPDPSLRPYQDWLVDAWNYEHQVAAEAEDPAEQLDYLSRIVEKSLAYELPVLPHSEVIRSSFTATSVSSVTAPAPQTVVVAAAVAPIAKPVLLKTVPSKPAAPVVKPMEDREITLNVQSMPIKRILEAISRQTGANFILDKEIQDLRLSTFMQKVRLRDALTGLLEAHEIGYERIGESTTYSVRPLSRTRPYLVTRIFHLRYTQLAESSGGGDSAPSSAFTIVGAGAAGGGGAKSGGGGGGKSGGAGNLCQVVQSMLSPAGRLEVLSQTNSLVVTDIASNFERIEELIKNLDTLVPEILIEVAIVETDADTGRKLGLSYGGADGAMASLTGPARVLNYPTQGSNLLFPGPNELSGATVSGPNTFGGNSSLGTFFGLLSFQEFHVVLNAIETSGHSQYLARPKILTLNNKPAEISITANTVVGIQSASLISQNGLLTTTAERSKTGISLRVTPQVNEGGLVTLLLEPTVSRASASEFFPAQFVDPQSQSVRTSVRVKDGFTLLIGGLLTDEKTKTKRSVPFLGSIPLLGRFFRYEVNTMSKKELMIFITPRVVKE